MKFTFKNTRRDKCPDSDLFTVFVVYACDASPFVIECDHNVHARVPPFAIAHQPAYYRVHDTRLPRTKWVEDCELHVAYTLPDAIAWVAKKTRWDEIDANFRAMTHA